MSTFIRLHYEGIVMSAGEYHSLNVRGTLPFPTKSAVLGLISAALNYRRGTHDVQMAQMHHACRVSARELRSGPYLDDYQIIQGVNTYTGKGDTVTLGVSGLRGRMTGENKRSGRDVTVFNDTVEHIKGEGSDDKIMRNKTSVRNYMNDWAFEVWVEWDNEHAPCTAQEALDALKHPAMPLYLGRKHCQPLVPVVHPDTEVVEANDVLGLFRLPDPNEVGALCLWARYKDPQKNEKRIREMISQRYSENGTLYLDIDNPPADSVEIEVRDHLIHPTARVFAVRKVYVLNRRAA